MMSTTAAATTTTSRWAALADRVLTGEPATREDALAVLQASDLELLDLLAAAYRVRHAHFGNIVKMNFLVNAKSGHCPEDCGYCSQGKNAKAADIPRYKLYTEEQIVEHADRCVGLGATTCCIVISGRGPSERELTRVCDGVRSVKSKYPDLKICACLGLLTPDQAIDLKQAGVERLNHNLNTSEQHYDSICATHTYADRVQTLKAAAAAGLSLCSGGITGMGESDADLVDMTFALRDLNVDSIPVNFLVSIDGTPMQGRDELDPRRCLKVVCMVRFVHPDREIRLSGGREVHLRSMQTMGLYPANALFVADYLTTPGQAPSADVQMIEDAGFVVETLDHMRGRCS
ncbi:MAG: biotin synthase BioB [Planctomycetota bacterium]